MRQTIITMTSHDRRVAESAHRAIYTLLDQTIPPDKILLWLDEAYTDPLPENLQRLLCERFEVRRGCENIGVHSKWFWAFQEFPDADIVTCDDDRYYFRDFLLYLQEKRQERPDDVICYFRCSPRDNVPRLQNGCNGVMYPPHERLYKDVLRKDLFTTLCPTNDEMWLWVQAYLANVKISFTRYGDMDWTTSKQWAPWIHPYDQCGDTALWWHNCTENHDTHQWEALCQQYPSISNFVD